MVQVGKPLEGQVVLVTGASGGIGSQACRRLAELGARVIAHYHRGTAKAEALVASLPGEGHRALGFDLREPEAIAAGIDRAVSEAGRLDILVNNAGIFERHPPMDCDFPTWQEHWQRAIETNLLGPAHGSYCAARHMSRQGGGRIINVSSRGAFRGEPEAPAYGASKAGLNALSQSLAAALAPQGIYVFAVAPGFVETAMARDYLTGEMAEAIRQQSPLGRVATAADVAYWIGCLACPGGEFATGTVIDVNGASYLRT